MSNLGPLTTTFTPPSDCSWASVNIVEDETIKTTIYDYKGIVWPDPLRCFPSGYPNAYSDRLSGYYSPGICPSGWTAYPTSSFPDPSETTAYCCPPGFLVESWRGDMFGISFPCLTTYYGINANPALIISGSIDIATRPYGDNTDGFITDYHFSMPLTVWEVFGVQVRYRAEDFGSHASSNLNLNIPTAQITSRSPTATSPNSAATSSASTAATSYNNGAMSNGVKIGVLLGLPLFIIIFGSTIAFIFIRRRGRQTRRWPHSNDYDDYKDDDEQKDNDEFKAELPGNKLGVDGGEMYAGKAELDGVGKVELDGTRPPAELDISIRHVELDDTSLEMSLLGNQPIGIRRVRAKRISSAQRAATKLKTTSECIELGDLVRNADRTVTFEVAGGEERSREWGESTKHSLLH